MTRNQIDYLNFRENQRHNIKSESQNEFDLGIKDRSQREIQRHNTVTELQAVNELNELARHNQTSEAINAATQQETVRHNVRSENISE